MTNKKRLIHLVLLAAMLLCWLVMATGCSGSSGNGEFTFTGSGTFDNGNTYNIKIVGDTEEDGEQTFQLTINELPALELDGTWVKVDGKGYKLYFDDYDEAYVYTKYDTKKGQFSFTYNLTLGGAYGSQKIRFTYNDNAFAKEYDGIGLGMKPPTLIGGGWGSTNATSWRPATLTCYEDGTVSLVCANKGNTRTGTWSYNEETNQYSFVLVPETYTYLRAGEDAVYDKVQGNAYGMYCSANEKYVRHIYYDSAYTFKTGDEYKAAQEAARVEIWQYDASESDAYNFRDFDTSTWNGDYDDPQDVHEFVTTFDEETQTYSVTVVVIDGFYYVDRVLSYTLED